MKKYLVLICAVLMLMLAACNNQVVNIDDVTESVADGEDTETVASTQSEKITDNTEADPQPVKRYNFYGKAYKG